MGVIRRAEQLESAEFGGDKEAPLLPAVIARAGDAILKETRGFPAWFRANTAR